MSKTMGQKVDAILALERPQTVTQLHSFIGVVTFYHDMFPHWSHDLAPLAAQVGKKTLNWTVKCRVSDGI